ncbi:hypothetical protein GN244_ATG09964 [Phytophthora infestans]|uniref:Uncharacterized protein n=1 Tax=Phytophthora infestans TaxID=4787 RepID=A0A833T6Y4_PHYIN|nr:hypothetical protein GN244_ATG09964 [Phytophthora infestans]KAF4150179.1 hypothetical protein GN958_ATG00600 [Phytophthora infestans]
MVACGIRNAQGKRQKLNAVETLLEQHSDAPRQRMEKRQALEDAKEELRLKKREVELKEERKKREAEQSSIALAIQQVQLEAAKRSVTTGS